MCIADAHAAVRSNAPHATCAVVVLVQCTYLFYNDNRGHGRLRTPPKCNTYTAVPTLSEFRWLRGSTSHSLHLVLAARRCGTFASMNLGGTCLLLSFQTLLSATACICTEATPAIEMGRGDNDAVEAVQARECCSNTSKIMVASVGVPA